MFHVCSIGARGGGDWDGLGELVGWVDLACDTGENYGTRAERLVVCGFTYGSSSITGGKGADSTSDIFPLLDRSSTIRRTRPWTPIHAVYTARLAGTIDQWARARARIVITVCAGGRAPRQRFTTDEQVWEHEASHDDDGADHRSGKTGP